MHVYRMVLTELSRREQASTSNAANARNMFGSSEMNVIKVGLVSLAEMNVNKVGLDGGPELNVKMDKLLCLVQVLVMISVVIAVLVLLGVVVIVSK